MLLNRMLKCQLKMLPEAPMLPTHVARRQMALPTIVTHRWQQQHQQHPSHDQLRTNADRWRHPFHCTQYFTIRLQHKKSRWKRQQPQPQAQSQRLRQLISAITATATATTIIK